MTTITKERIELFIKKPLDNGLTRGEQMELARIALASLEAEPVAWLLSGGGAKNNVSFDSGNAYADPLREVTPLYTAPPAPVSVPAAMEMDDDFDSAFEHGKAVGWNAYRAAMLQGSQPVSKREQVRREHAEWSDKTFGDVGPVGPLKHLSKEALEAAAEPDDLSEWADMQFLLWDAQRRAGISDAEITAAMEDKLKINMERQWPEPKDGEPRLHIKEPGNSPVTPDGWISCSEQMPSAGEQVLAYRPDAPESNDPLIKMATYVGGSAHGHGFDCYCKPTHWMPLPAAPQEVNRG
ncbi:DUF550 domain-containing protein [Escherichia coli]|nr:DUF550 domain-containing protein [Escherichia coli]EMC8352495.1 DUF550 domain-containing protein [Escherichia coli]